MYEKNSRRRSRRVFKSRCLDCVYSIFDETWGEYKCNVKKHKVYNASDYTDCRDFERGAGTLSAKDDEYYE